MKKRIIALMAVAVMLMGVLSGCKEENKTQEQQTSTLGTIQASLVLACQEDEAVLTAISEHIDRFQAVFTGITVTVDSSEEAETAATIICKTTDELVDLANEGKLLDMDIWLNDAGYVMDGEGGFVEIGLSADQQSDLVSLYMDECQQVSEDGRYMMPLYRESLMIYYSQTFFEENELETPYTWEHVEQNCAAIKQNNPEAKPLVCKDLQGLFLSICAQYGEEYTAEGGVTALLATEGAQKAATMLNDWYQKGYMTTEDLSLQDDGVYMVIDTSSKPQMPASDGEAFTFELGVMNLPKVQDDSGKSLSTGMNVAIVRTDDDDQMLAAWLFVKSLCTDVQFQSDIAIAGNYTPVLTSVEIYEEYSKYLDGADGGENVGALTALSCMEQQHKLFAAPAYEGSLEEKEKLTALLDSCLQATDGVAAILEAGIS